jgi:uncharacterized membrane protein YdjX (TVP38/TMEM64 family)
MNNKCVLFYYPEIVVKSLLKIMLTLGTFFFSTFFILNVTGVITVEKIQVWLELAKSANPLYVGLIIAILLFADLFIAVPTLTVMILSGFFLGPVYGVIAVTCGLLVAGTCGYAISRQYGYMLINRLIKDKNEQADAINLFREHGALVILLSRATPILPEVSACMAGMTKFPFSKFLVLWLISSVPYALIATYAGSVSTIENPGPALLAAVGLTTLLWFGCFMLRRSRRRETKMKEL